MALNVIYKNRNGTTAEWAASTYILEKGELGVDTTLNIAKIGDGVKTWKDLPTFNDVNISNLVTTNTNQTISGNKLFLNPVQVGGSSNLEDYTKITSTDITVRAGEDASWYKIGNDKFSHGDTTNTYTATLPNKSGTVALLSDIPTPPTNYVTTDTEQTINGSKTFSKAVSVSTDTDAGFKITGGGNTWEINARTSEGPLNIVGDETGVYHQTYQFPDKSGTIALTNDIPSVPNNILTYDYTFDTTGKNLSYSLMIAKNPNPAESMTRIDAGSITFRDLGRNNYEGTTQLVVAQVNNSNPVVVSLPSTSGELALKSDIPSTDNYVTLDTAQTISGVKTFTGAIQLQGVGIAAKVGGENSSYTNILKGGGNVVEVGSTGYQTRIYSNGRISVYDYSTSPYTSEKVAYQSEIPTIPADNLTKSNFNTQMAEGFTLGDTAGTVNNQTITLNPNDENSGASISVNYNGSMVYTKITPSGITFVNPGGTTHAVTTGNLKTIGGQSIYGTGDIDNVKYMDSRDQHNVVINSTGMTVTDNLNYTANIIDASGIKYITPVDVNGKYYLREDNVKTVNGSSIYGSGDISVTPTLKTVNSTSLTGDGNIYLKEFGVTNSNELNFKASASVSDLYVGLATISETGATQTNYTIGSYKFMKGTGSTSAFADLYCAKLYTSSDERLKENIKPYEPTTSVLDLSIKEFNYKDSKVKSVGVIAQEVQKLFPDAVSADKKSGYLSVDDRSLMYMLMAEVKKLRDRVNELEGR